MYSLNDASDLKMTNYLSFYMVTSLNCFWERIIEIDMIVDISCIFLFKKPTTNVHMPNQRKIVHVNYGYI